VEEELVRRGEKKRVETVSVRKKKGWARNGVSVARRKKERRVGKGRGGGRLVIYHRDIVRIENENKTAFI